MILYDNPISGNAYKVRLLLALLRLDYERVEVSVVDRGDRETLLQGKSPSYRIPVLELDDGRCLAESNAILWYLADGTSYLPEDQLDRAKVLQWMFFEQYEHEPAIAVARFLSRYAPDPGVDRETIERCRARGLKALQVLDGALGDAAFLVGDRYSVADISLYAYTHVAAEADIDLGPFANVEAWLARIAGQPRHVAMTGESDS